ncbi:MAG: hypothetical protein K6U80_04990 [Firmicutes bacterium]|nr:hypothetical protein [Bacillota bacterium]
MAGNTRIYYLAVILSGTLAFAADSAGMMVYFFPAIDGLISVKDPLMYLKIIG